MTIIIITGKGKATKVRAFSKLVFTDLTDIVRALQVKYSSVAPKVSPAPVTPHNIPAPSPDPK